jgi:hypothetical protein
MSNKTKYTNEAENKTFTRVKETLKILKSPHT